MNSPLPANRALELAAIAQAMEGEDLVTCEHYRCRLPWAECIARHMAEPLRQRVSGHGQGREPDPWSYCRTCRAGTNRARSKRAKAAGIVPARRQRYNPGCLVFQPRKEKP
jgi:hypothetical protein